MAQSAQPTRPETPKTAEDAAKQRADALAAAQFDPGAVARMEALEPSSVYHLPGQAQGNPGVQGFVFRPHQEPNPGEVSLTEPYQRTALADQVRLEKEARDRHWAKYREGAQARGEPVPERGGPLRLRVLVDISAHSVLPEDKLAGIAAAADGLLAALHDAGIRPQKAGVSGLPL
jgi:hypothetical protein